MLESDLMQLQALADDEWGRATEGEALLAAWVLELLARLRTLEQKIPNPQ